MDLNPDGIFLSNGPVSSFSVLKRLFYFRNVIPTLEL